MEYLYGNYTSQFFANIYLNELDQYIVNELKVKYYVKYMDDFILITKSKIEEFCESTLKLQLNHKSQYFPYKFGVDFCGYRIWTTHRTLRNSSKTKINRKIKAWNNQWKDKKINFKLTMQSLNSWLGHIKHCNSYKLKLTTLKKCDFLYTDYMEYDEYIKSQENQKINKNN